MVEIAVYAWTGGAISVFEDIRIRVDGASGVRLLVELYCVIFTIQYPVPLFSLCTKSLIAVLKVQNNCLRKTGAVLFVSREIIRGNIIKGAK